MASTWSALKIELLETGANSGTWGTLTNANLGDAVLGEAITGSATVDFASDADVTITLTDVATTQAARNLRLNITESSSGVGSVRNLILGSGCQIEKFYLVRNNGTGAKTIKNTSGTGISVPAGKSTLVYNDGTNVVDGASYFTSLTLGSALPVASGGTGLTAGTSGGVLAYTASGTLASSGALAQYGVVIGGGAGAVPTSTAVGTATHVLTSNGSGVAPTFQAPATSGTVTSVAVSGGTTGLTVTGSPITSSGTITLAGTVAVANGGTGLTAGTSGGVLAYTASGTLASSAALAANALVIGGGAGVAPSTTTTGTGILTFLGTPSSANLAAALTDETGSGANVFATSPTLVTPVLGTPTSGTLSNCTGLPLTTGVTGTLPVANGGTGSATLTANNVLLGNGTSALQAIAPSTSGNVLTSNGTTWASTAPAGGGSWVFLSTVTASSVSTANIETTFNSTYDVYMITGINSTASAVRLKIGGSYVSDAQYSAGTTFLSGNTNALSNSAGNSREFIELTAVYFQLFVYDPTSTSATKGIFYHRQGGTPQVWGIGGGAYGGSTAALTGVQMYGQGSNFSGTYKLYGLKKS